MLHPGPRIAAYALALIAAAVIASELLWMPVQSSDSLGELLDAQSSPSIWSSFTGAFGTTAYLRPFRIAQIRVLFDAAQGQHYWAVFRGFHALLLIATIATATLGLTLALGLGLLAADSYSRGKTPLGTLLASLAAGVYLAVSLATVLLALVGRRRG